MFPSFLLKEKKQKIFYLMYFLLDKKAPKRIIDITFLDPDLHRGRRNFFGERKRKSDLFDTDCGSNFLMINS